MREIGLPLDLRGGRLFLTDLGGSIYGTTLDGSNETMMLAAREI
jgi:hypothetical protein